MSSNKDKKRIKDFKFKNEKLYNRITITFSSMFLSLTLLILVLAVILCAFLLLNISKNNFKSYNSAIINEITKNKNAVLALSANERLQYIYANYVLPVSEGKREVSFQISDNSQSISNDRNFDIIADYAAQLKFQNTSKPNELMLKKIKREDMLYHYLSVDINLGSYHIYLTTYQDYSEKYIYTLFLSIIIGSAFFIVVIFMTTLGRSITRKALQPLQKIAEAVKSISEENLSVNIQKENDDQVDMLIIELNRMLQRLNISFEEQKRFVSDVSHELRIPITIIQGYVDIIQTWAKNDEKLLDESLDAIFTETTNMKDLVEKLLLLQNLGSGNYNFEMEKIDVNQLLQKSIFETKMLTQSHEIEHKLCAGKPVVYADSGLLSQAVRSIIDNSIKYTNEGGTITVASSCDKHRVRIHISDTGCGIEEGQLQKVKERFYRVDSARTKKTGGSGLGLSIVNASIISMGGELSIKSELNVGSEVIISLPRYGTRGTDSKSKEKDLPQQSQ